jgi:hypothetical protein
VPATKIAWRLARVSGVIEETPNATTIVLDRPEGWPGHLAGQHVDVRLTAEDGYQTERSYSIGSAPEDADVVLTVERIEDGESGMGLPQLQSITIGDLTEGYGDLFIASLLGGIVASEHGPQLGIALVTALLSLLLAVMFLVVDSIPSTVPAAVALLVFELAKPGLRLRGIASPLPPAPACWQPDP